MVAGMRVRRTTVRRCRTSAAGLAGSSAAVVRRGRAVIRPKYAERLAIFETTMLAPVFAALESQDRPAFERAFAAATENANLQHVETGYAYIRWTLPKDPPQDVDLGPER